jgi:nicotinamidase/pyrazinamidase
MWNDRIPSDETTESGMHSRDFIFWEVDVQADFMLPGGKLYVPGAEKLLPNIRKLTDAARRGDVFLVSHGDFHPANDPEFKQFPPHCLKGTAGAELVPEALTDDFVRVENTADAKLPEDLFKYRQIVLEKQTLDIFESRHADALVERLGNDAEFVVFGVVTEYCVSFAAKGLLKRKRRVAVVRDAIETLAPEVGEKTRNELQSLGARLVTTDEILRKLSAQSHA